MPIVIEKRFKKDIYLFVEVMMCKMKVRKLFISTLPTRKLYCSFMLTLTTILVEWL